MRKLNFDDVVFGGDPKRNIQLQQTIPVSIPKEKKKATSLRKKANLDLPMDSMASMAAIKLNQNSILSPKASKKKMLNLGKNLGKI